MFDSLLKFRTIPESWVRKGERQEKENKRKGKEKKGRKRLKRTC